MTIFAAMIFGASCAVDDSEPVIVFAASSMTQAMQEVKIEFEAIYPAIELEIIFSGSQTLAMQINEGAPADLFISADREQIQRVRGFTEPEVLVENRLVAVTPLGSEHATLSEAINQAARIVVAQQDVPAGRYTLRALEELAAREAAEKKIVSYEHSVRGVLNKVIMGQADLGFVYRTDAINADAKVSMIELPPHIQSRTETWITRRNNPKVAHWASGDVLEFIMDSPESKRIFMHYGFLLSDETP